jgi:hypothetical protein
MSFPGGTGSIGGARRGGRRPRAPRVVLLVLAALMVSAAPLVHSASLTRTATATATVNGLAKLTLSSSTLVFPDADPDTVTSIPANGSPLTITAKARTSVGSVVTLVVKSSGNLQSGLDTIPASQVRWTATGTGFVAGTMSDAAAQTVGSWVSSGSWTGTQTYTLRNAWTYAVGTYTATLTYTLTAP